MDDLILKPLNAIYDFIFGIFKVTIFGSDRSSRHANLVMSGSNLNLSRDLKAFFNGNINAMNLESYHQSLYM